MKYSGLDPEEIETNEEIKHHRVSFVGVIRVSQL